VPTNGKDRAFLPSWWTRSPFSRAPLDFQEEAIARLETYPEVCAAIKRALDPNGILSPGRYGIG
jgi:FAD/FMN-containing dehydrogenase